MKNLLAILETVVRFLGWEDPLEKGTTTHSSVLAWRISTDRGAWCKVSDTTELLILAHNTRTRAVPFDMHSGKE